MNVVRMNTHMPAVKVLKSWLIMYTVSNPYRYSDGYQVREVRTTASAEGPIDFKTGEKFVL